MSRLLELREKISQIVQKYSLWLKLACRFALTLLSLIMVRIQLGTISGRLIHPLVIAALSVLGICLPAGAITLLVSGYILICVFAISPAAGVGALILLLAMLFLYAAVLPSKAGLAAVTALTGMLNISGIVAIPTGLFCSISSIIPAVFGLSISGIIDTVRLNYQVFATGMAATASGQGELIYFAASFLQNERFWLLTIGLILTAITVFAVSRLPFSYAWLFSAAAGVAVYVLIMMTGNVIFGISVNPLRLGISVIGGFLLSLTGQVFRYLLDSAGTEYLQAEDGEYVYYIKAIPKYAMTPQETSIKNITEHGE